jgi:hypothetical protein
MRRRFTASLATISLLVLTLTGCGGEGNAGRSGDGNGEVVIGLTDAPADFSAQTVMNVSLVPAAIVVARELASATPFPNLSV